MTTRSHSALPRGSESEDLPIPLAPKVRRLESLDMLRGLLMILMALDHTRDYFSNAGVDATDPHHSWPLLFFTRWVTHLCAPGFIALAGASVYLQRQRGKPLGELRRVLLTRGLWLVVLEWTLISFGWSFGWKPFLQVIWAIGLSMIGLAMLLDLPAAVIAGIGAVIVVGHNLLDPIKAKAWGDFANLWKVAHEPGVLTLGGSPVAFQIYPVLPWFGVICLGYGWGVIAQKAPLVRRKISVALGTAFLTVFAALRLTNAYGDANRLDRFDTVSRSVMSMLQVQKYPPSLQYLLATLGVLLLLYALFDRAAERDWFRSGRRVIETYGRVPFFYYVLHIYLLHLAALLGTMAEHLHWHLLLGYTLVSPLPPGWGFSLPVVYAVWFATVAILYWPCVWFSQVKSQRHDWWLSYL